MNTKVKPGILACAMTIALSFCALTAFASPLDESSGDTTSTPAPATFSENVALPLTFTIKTAEDGGITDVSKNQFTDLQSALDAIPSDAGAVVFRIESDLHTDYREYDGGRKRITFSIPADRGITSFTIEGAKADKTVAMGSGSTSYSISVFANGVPIIVQGDIKMNAFVYGGADASDPNSLHTSGSSSITVEEGATVSYVYGGSYNTDFHGDSAIVVNGSAVNVFGGCRTFAHAYAIDSHTLPDAAATMRGNSSIVIGPKGTVSGLIAGGGNADAQSGSSVTPSQPDALSSTATLEGSTSIVIDGTFNQVYGGGNADATGATSSNPMTITAMSNVSGDASIAIGPSARISGFDKAAFGGGKAQTSQSAIGYASANVGGSTTVEVLGDDAAKTDETQVYFSRLGGGGYATNPYAEANVGGSTTVKTARATSSSNEGMMGGGYALRGASANVAETSHVEVFGIEGQREDYSNAKCIIGGGFALVEDAVETSATTGSTEVIVHTGAQLESISTAPSVGLIGGGYAAGGNSDASVAGASSVTIEGGTSDKWTTVPDGIVGGGIVYKQNFSSYLEGSSSKADVAGGSTVTIGDFCTLEKSLIGGGLAYGPTAKNASAQTGDLRVETGHDVTVRGEFVAAGKVLNSSNSNADAQNTAVYIGANSTLSSNMIGGGCVTGSYQNMSANVESINTFIGDSTVINGNLTICGGFTSNAVDGEASVLGDVHTTFGDNVKTKSFIGGGLAYNGSSGCTVDVKGAVSSTFGSSYADPYEFIAAGYVFYNTTSCTANAGSVETTFGEDAALADVSGAGWVRTNSDDGSADICGSASFTLGNNSKIVTKFVGGGQVQASTASHANVGTELGSDATAVTTRMAKGLTMPLMYGGGCVSSSTDSQANINGSIENMLDGESAAGSFYDPSPSKPGSFNGGGCVRDSSTNSQADINGDIESTLTGFSFASAGADYLTRVVGNGAVLGGSASHANTQGNVATRLVQCTINGSGDNSQSMPYLGGRSNSDVGGDATLILQDSSLANQTLRVEKGWSSAIGGMRTLQLVGTMTFDDWSYPDWTDNEVQLMFGDADDTPTEVTMQGIVCKNGPIDVVVFPHSSASLTNEYDDGTCYLQGLRNLTVSENAALSVTESTAQAKLSGNLSGAGTISLPAGGSIAGDGTLDGNLTLLVNEDKARAAVGQTYFDFSDQSTGSVDFVDPAKKLALKTDDSTSGRTAWTMQELTYHVSFKANDGTETMFATQDVVHDGHAVKPDPAPERQGYAFDGWFEDAEGTQAWDFDADAVTGDVTLYAKWTKLHTVTFEPNNGADTSTVEVRDGDKASAPQPDPVREHYTLEGWYPTDDFSGDPWDFDADAVTDDVTLYARWAPVEYTVTFDARGGFPAPLALQVKYGATVAEPAQQPAKKDFVFAGWYNDAACGGDQWDFDADKVTGDMTLYAKWDDGIKVNVEISEDGQGEAHGTVDPETPQVFTGEPLLYTLTPDYGYRIDAVTADGVPLPVTMQADLRTGVVSYEPKSAGTVVVTFAPLDNQKADDIIDNLPTIAPDDPPDKIAEKTDTVLNAKLDYESMSEEEKEAVGQEVVDKLNEAVASLPNVDVKVEVAIGTELASNISIPEEQQSRFISAVSKDEIEQIKSGTAGVLKVIAEIKDIDKPANTDEQAALEGELGSYEIGQHFSASVTKLLYENATDSDPKDISPITTLPAPVQLTFDVPVPLINTVEGTTRSFAMVRTHLGTTWEAALLNDEDGDETDGKMTISTDRFSTYSIVYKDAHTVTFESNSGNAIDPQTIDNGGKVVKPADPTRMGFIFAGWYKDAGFADAWDFATDTVTGPVTLYAKWTEEPPAPVNHTVTFVANGGLPEPSAQTIVEGGKAAEPDPAPEKTGYVFGGWFRDEAGTQPWDFAANTVEADMKLYAAWTPETYPVTFESNGGSDTPDQTVPYRGTVTEPADPTRDGYDFAGWWKDAAFTSSWNFADDTVTGPVTLYAKWTESAPPTPDTHTVVFDARGGAPAPDDQTVEDGTTAEEPVVEPQRTGYAFGGWFSDEECTTAWDFSTPVEADLTLYAKWTVETYTVSFDADGGTPEPEEQTVAYGQLVQPVQAPEKEGYEFVAWYADADLTTSWDFAHDVVEGPVTLHAKWNKLPDDPKPPVDPDPDTPSVTPPAPDDPKPSTPETPGSGDKQPHSGSSAETPTSESPSGKALAPTGDALPMRTLGALALGALVAIAAADVLMKRRHS